MSLCLLHHFVICHLFFIHCLCLLYMIRNSRINYDLLGFTQPSGSDAEGQEDNDSSASASTSTTCAQETDPGRPGLALAAMEGNSSWNRSLKTEGDFLSVSPFSQTFAYKQQSPVAGLRPFRWQR